MSNADDKIAPSLQHPDAFRAGMFRLQVLNPHNGKNFPVSVWYPTHATESKRLEGIYNLSCAMNAPIAPGAYGFIIISHGSGGSDTNHHDWAETLARAGYIVAAPRHLGDSHDVNMGLGSREQLLERPRQLAAVLKTVPADPRLLGSVAKDRIGLIGFSAGGYSVLTIMGARPDFSRWRNYCRTHSNSVVICPINHPINTPRPTPEDWDGLCIPSIGAAVLLAPFALLFDPDNLKKVQTPVRLYRARDESIARNPANADSVADNLPTRPEIIDIPGNHYVFIAPVTDKIARKYPEFYVDEPGIDRPGIHQTIGLELVDFFNRKLLHNCVYDSLSCPLIPLDPSTTTCE